MFQGSRAGFDLDYPSTPGGIVYEISVFFNGPEVAVSGGPRWWRNNPPSDHCRPSVTSGLDQPGSGYPLPAGLPAPEKGAAVLGGAEVQLVSQARKLAAGTPGHGAVVLRDEEPALVHGEVLAPFGHLSTFGSGRRGAWRLGLLSAGGGVTDQQPPAAEDYKRADGGRVPEFPSGDERACWHGTETFLCPYTRLPSRLVKGGGEKIFRMASGCGPDSEEPAGGKRNRPVTQHRT